MALLIIWLWLLDARGKRNAEITGTSLFRAFLKLRKLLFGIIGTVLAGALGSALWGWFAPLFTQTP